MRVIAFVPHPERGASARYRVYQMISHLREHDIEVEVRPFLGDAAFARLYAQGGRVRKALDLAGGAAGRWRALAEARNFDVALIHRELSPLRGSGLLRRLRRYQPRWVFDFDDSVFIPNVSDANRAFAGLKGHDQAVHLAAGARVVSAGNPWLAAWARRMRPAHDTAEVVVVPTAVDTARWAPVRRPPGPPRICWIGSHSTVRYLEPLRPALARLAARHPTLELHVVGARFEAEGVRVVASDWSQEEEVARVGACDIGISPLPMDDWSLGKCGLKLLLYMSMGLAAVASPVGVHTEIVRDDGNALLADSAADFERQLTRLIEDPGLRERLGREARATVETRYSLAAVAPTLAGALRTAARAA